VDKDKMLDMVGSILALKILTGKNTRAIFVQYG
jgi:hypothetical protein